MLDDRVKNPHIGRVLLIMGVFVALLIYVVPAFTRGDLIWFVGGLSDKPDKITIWRQGKPLVIGPDGRGYAQIAKVANDELAKVNGLGGGPSPQTIAYIRSQTALELHFAQPITIHAAYALGNPDTILVPLEGWAAQNNFYLAKDGVFGAWEPHIAPTSVERIRQTLKDLGYY